MSQKAQLIYKLDNINADDGVDIFEIAPILIGFGELVRSANDALGLNQKIDVKVKPFREGSWITEFVFQNQPIANLLSYINTQEGQDVVVLLSLLGLDVHTGVTSVVDVIRFTKGVVSNFKKDEEGDSITYENASGEKLTVPSSVHRLVQSPLIQYNYYNSVVTPLDKFPDATSVSTRINKNDMREQTFTDKDKSFFEEYAKAELLEDVEENVSIMKSVFIKPKRGPYSGDEKAYSFLMGDTVIWPTTIEDESFLGKLKTGDIRPYSEDVLKVDLEIRQKKDASNKLIVSYSIKKVVEYIKYERPRQIKIDESL